MGKKISYSIWMQMIILLEIRSSNSSIQFTRPDILIMKRLSKFGHSTSAILSSIPIVNAYSPTSMEKYPNPIILSIPTEPQADGEQLS